ncbi:MAG: hypothetical protein ACRETC_08200 [Gammaproteobacteria bacterium]
MKLSIKSILLIASLIPVSAYAGPYCTQLVKFATGVGKNHDQGLPISTSQQLVKEHYQMMKQLVYPNLPEKDMLKTIQYIYDNNLGASQAHHRFSTVCAELEKKGKIKEDKH